MESVDNLPAINALPTGAFATALLLRQVPSLATKIDESSMMSVYKIFLLFCFSPLFPGGILQSYRTYQKSELLRQAAEREKSINELFRSSGRSAKLKSLSPQVLWAF